MAPDEAPDTLAGDSDAAVAAAAAAAMPSAEEEVLGAAALSARELVVGEVLGDLVAVHATAFCDAAGEGCAPGDAAPADFLRSYELGVQLLRAAGLVLPAALDAATASGHLYAASCRFRQLSQAAPSGTAAARAGVDMQAPCVEEAVLVQAPLLALRDRLRCLLEEWPDHPGLLQVGCRATRAPHERGAGRRPTLTSSRVCRLPTIACLPSLAHPLGRQPPCKATCSRRLTPCVSPHAAPPQLSAVIDRLLGMPVTAPLKAMLTGVELLLAKGQLW